MTMLPVCNACRDGQDFPTAITMAFQPIVDVSTRSIYAGEALVRGINGESAGSILAAVDERNRYAFDQALPHQGDRMRCADRATDAAVDQLHAQRGL